MKIKEGSMKPGKTFIIDLSLDAWKSYDSREVQENEDGHVLNAAVKYNSAHSTPGKKGVVQESAVSHPGHNIFAPGIHCFFFFELQSITFFSLV
jgi:hypothetical protein